MKLFFSQLAYFFNSSRERNMRTLIKFMALLVVMVACYSVGFHYLMRWEGQLYSWITGVYWTLTVMSTLGFGDITFHSDLGRLFSILVLLSGMVFFLIMLPFTFIQFFYAPWLEAQARARAPRRLPEDVQGHVILTSHGPLAVNLVERLTRHDYGYAVLLPDLPQALELHDQGWRVVVGDPGDPQTWRNLRVERSALVVADAGDMLNTNIAATVREVSQEVAVATTADNQDSVDVLELAGSTHVFQFMQLLGRSLARKTLGIRAGDNVVGSMGELLVAETPVMRTPLAGVSLAESGLRQETGLTVIGLWEGGRYIAPGPDTVLDEGKVLLLAGTAEQLARYDALYASRPREHGPVLILGGGRVGRAAAAYLDGQGLDYRIIEKNPRLAGDDPRTVTGSGADLATLERAGLQQAPSIIITTHDDHTNIYLTIYCRKLRPDIQIISRANSERTEHKLHSAGADQVMSYALLAASTLFNLLRPGGLQILAEGLNLFQQPVPDAFVGRPLEQCPIRSRTGCSLVAVGANGGMRVSPEPSYTFRPGDELYLVGSDQDRERYLEAYG
jgi:Trk K+ transport system NAD-binding subunit